MSKRAAIYTRISQDRAGAGLGVQRQQQDCEALAARNRWDVVAVESDNDISAYSGKPRPGYRALLGLIESGQVDIVVAWHNDRLHRSPRELEEYIDASERNAVTTHTVQAGVLDLSTPSGRMTARIMGAVARQESEHKAERVRRARQQAAENGRAHGSLGYAYARDAAGRHRVVQAEAKIVREIADRILAGDALGAIARDLNDRGVPTPQGGMGWRASNIPALVCAGRYCGWREYTPGERGQRGRGRGFGTLVAEGDWPAVLDRQTTEALRAILSDPARRSVRTTRHLLSGVLRCSKCGSPMTGQTDRGRPRYACLQQPGLPDRCGGTTITGNVVDEVVTGMVLEALADVPVYKTQSVADDPAVVDLAKAHNDLDALAVDKVEGRITEREWLAMRRALLARIDALETQTRGQARASARRMLPADARKMVRAWDDLSIGQQRVLIRSVLRHVTVLPGSAGSPADRLDPMWLV